MFMDSLAASDCFVNCSLVASDCFINCSPAAERLMFRGSPTCMNMYIKNNIYIYIYKNSFIFASQLGVPPPQLVRRASDVRALNPVVVVDIYIYIYIRTLRQNASLASTFGI